MCAVTTAAAAAGKGHSAVKAGSKKVRKPAIVPSSTSGPAGPSAAVAAVLEGHGVLMGTSHDEHHLIHKPTKGLGAGDLTGAMHVTDAISFAGLHGQGGHGHTNSPMVSKVSGFGVAGVCAVRLCAAVSWPFSAVSWPF
jgi:hypothetical protein